MKHSVQEILAAIVVVAVLVGIPLLVWWYEDYSFRSRYGDDVRIIKLTAAAFQGRVTRQRVGGYNYWSGNFPRLESITVHKGEKIVLVITSADVTHSFRITPEFPVKQPIEMEGGHTAIVEFVADRVGTYLAECKSFCGCAHHGMFFKIVVTDTPSLGRSNVRADRAGKHNGLASSRGQRPRQETR